jgi:hypothetical protein
VPSFAILVISGKPNKKEVVLASQLRNLRQLNNPFKMYSLTNSEIELFNPNTLNLPIFQSSVDCSLVRKIYIEIPVFVNIDNLQNFWDVDFSSMFHMSNDSHLFFIESKLRDESFLLKGNIFEKDSIRFLPLYESKNTDHYNHRFATFEGIEEEERYRNRPPINEVTERELKSLDFTIIPRYWVKESDINKSIFEFWKYEWLIGFRNAINAFADSRSVKFTIIPRCGVGNSMPLIFVNKRIDEICCLVANFNSLVLDYVAKQKASGGNLNFYVVKQLPVLPPDRYSQNDINYITPRVLELTYTAWDIKPFADDLWNPTRSQSEVEGSKTETDSILTQASDKKQLKFALDIEITGKKQLELTTPPDPTHQTHLRQLILEQWQANRAAFPDTTQTSDENLEGIPLPPFIWHETRRAQIRAELDAYYAQLYGLTREELRYILDPADIYGTDFPSETFRVLKNNEMKKYGEYRTQRLVLEAWDKLGY